MRGGFNYWRKQQPEKKRRGRFNEEKNHGGPAAEKKPSARAEDRKPSHPNTDQMSENIQPKLAGLLRKNLKTQPNAEEWTPVVQTVGERLNFNFFFVLPVLLLERGGCTLLTAPWLYILTGLSHTHMFRSDRILEILEISGWKPEIVNLAGIFQDKKHP